MAHDPYKMLDNPFRLDGFVVVITGGAGAIGSAAGRLFAHLEAAEHASHAQADQRLAALQTMSRSPG